MKSKFAVFALFFLALLPEVYGASATSPVLTTKSGGKSFTFECNIERSKIKVFAGDKVDEAVNILIDQNLDDSDDCTGAEWSVNQMDGSNASLVMINPGRLGADAKMNVYALERGLVKFSGYLPAGADYMGENHYSYDFDQADGLWRDVYEIVDGEIILSREIRLVQSGSVCIDKNGVVIDSPKCSGKTLRAGKNKFLCVVYRKNIGEISPVKACSPLIGRH